MGCLILYSDSEVMNKDSIVVKRGFGRVYYYRISMIKLEGGDDTWFA
jgi:hypothetical protein